MNLGGAFGAAVLDVFFAILSVIQWLVIIAAVISWVNPDPRNPIVRFLHAATEPVLYQVRRRLPFVYAAGIDFSPLVLALGIQFLKIVVVQSLYELAVRITGVAPHVFHA